MKKIWVIYRIRNSSKELLDVPMLFCFTTKEVIFKEFSDQRDMDLFYVQKREVKNDFAKEFIDRYKRKELHHENIYTRNQINPMEKEQITILTTWEEIEQPILKVDIIFKELSKYVSHHVYSLKQEFLSALDTICYFDICRFAWIQHVDKPVLGLFDGFYNDSGLIIPSNLDYDEFALYMYFNGYTYK